MVVTNTNKSCRFSRYCKEKGYTKRNCTTQCSSTCLLYDELEDAINQEKMLKLNYYTKFEVIK